VIAFSGRDALEPPQQTKRGEVGVVHAPDLEHVEGAHLDAIRLALALAAVHDGRERTGLGSAFGCDRHRHVR
jgi:hypothetical protein